MKKVSKILLLFMALVACQVVSAQKIGRVLFQEVLFVLPEIDSVQLKLENHRKMLEADSEQMMVELNRKTEDYQKRKATFSPAIDQQKQKELNDFYNRMNEFNQTAQQELQNMEATLSRPLIDKVAAAIKTISMQKGLTLVIDPTQGANIMYIDEASVEDITPLVKTALGISPDAKPKMNPQMQQQPR